jgi:hypothetical protein
MRPPSLEKHQVDEIVRLFTNRGFGAKRISVFTGVPAKKIEKILQGRAFVKWTGGRLVHGRRQESKWRHGGKSTEDIYEVEL